MAPSSPSTTRRSPPSKNYRRSVNTQIIVCAHARRVVAVDGCRPGNRNDLVIARHTLAHLLAGDPTRLTTAAIGASTRSTRLGVTTAAEPSVTSTGANTAG
jgi:hypothetical protein